MTHLRLVLTRTSSGAVVVVKVMVRQRCWGIGSVSPSALTVTSYAGEMKDEAPAPPAVCRFPGTNNDKFYSCSGGDIVLGTIHRCQAPTAESFQCVDTKLKFGARVVTPAAQDTNRTGSLHQNKTV